MTDEQWLRRESAALLALLDTCEKPDTWTSIANDCVLEGSAERIYHHHLDPSAHSLEREENDAYAIQGTLLDDPPSPTLVTRLENAYKIAEQRLDEWKRHGYDFMSVFDPRFPGQLRMTIDVPPFLFASGIIIPNETAVSVVGSRACTPEGALFAIDCARMLTKRGIGVIAGLAKGIDTFAHKTALADGGRTIAFIGTGIDRQYPAENRDLQKRIENEGLVLSQFMPGAEPTRQTFPMRNALMSGYGIATIIADANEHSGTRIQARQAQRHGRPVILNHTVMDGTQWGRELADKPGVYVVRDASGASDALDYIMSIDDVDMLARQLLDAAPAAI